MTGSNIYHSVTLDKKKCLGCTTCLRRCPTEAIRIRDGKAKILNDKCIDCGMCIRICPYKAKVAVTDPLSDIFNFKHKIALPAPSLYGQYKNLESIDLVLNGLAAIGFDDVFEVAKGADITAAAIRKLLKTTTARPLISSACPAVVKLIQVRFPELIGNIADVLSPMEIAAKTAKQEYSNKHNVPIEQIGAFFITPCPAKMTSVRMPIGIKKSYVDGAISILEIYGQLSSRLKQPVQQKIRDKASWLGVNWASSGGESLAVGIDNALAVDGINNVINVLEEMENNKLSDLEFFEGLACEGGCIGGPLVFENTYVAKNSLRKTLDKMQKIVPILELSDSEFESLRFEVPIQERSVMKLDGNIEKAIKMMEDIDALTKTFKGLDCGSCGAPTCRALSEDIVHGYAREMDCIFKFKDRVSALARQMVDLSNIHDI